MRMALGLCALSAAAVVAVWAWLGAGVAMPPSPMARGEKLYCVSYAPFRGGQTPLDRSTHISAAQIEEDLTRLKPVTDCVRTYSNDLGLDQVVGIAQRHGMQVILGLWLSSKPDLNRQQIETAVALAKQYPTAIRAIVVGNEVLLRGEMSAIGLADTIRAVKAQVKVPVTYADVTAFWLRNRDIASIVDFVTIHILPYWEDFPTTAAAAGAYVDATHREVAAAFPGKKVLVGEVGWPSRGRMRDGALPSPANQARVLHDVLARARAGRYPVNIIEAFDQPWKRALEGTVGGYWGIYDDHARQPKFTWGAAVSNHPRWPWQAAGGAAFAVLVFGAALAAARRNGERPLPAMVWGAIAIIATVGGACVAGAAESLPIESLGIGGWLRSIALFVTAFGAPLAGATALASGRSVPGFAAVLARAEQRPRQWFACATGALLIAATVLTLQTALGLVFDPRYRDFPDSALTAAIVPFLVASLVSGRRAGQRGVAEGLAAAILALSAVYIAFNESLANWQSLWFCGCLLALAFTLRRARVAQS
jgi:glucan 1,3-beta-glucosidase